MVGIIFDLDDTLIETTKHFNLAKEKFRRLMGELGFPSEECLVTLNELDIKNVRKRGGFLKDCFPMALGETYEIYCQRHNRLICDNTRQSIIDIGWQVFEQEVEEVAGAKKVLDMLQGEFPLYLATKGEPDYQRAKITACGLEKYFQQVYVTPVKTSKEYLQIAEDYKLNKQASWIVGNSMKGDINPGIKSGFNCILVHHRHTWDYEDEPPIGQHYEVESIEKVPDIILKNK